MDEKNTQAYADLEEFTDLKASWKWNHRVIRAGKDPPTSPNPTTERTEVK